MANGYDYRLTEAFAVKPAELDEIWEQEKQSTAEGLGHNGQERFDARDYHVATLRNAPRPVVVVGSKPMWATRICACGITA